MSTDRTRAEAAFLEYLARRREQPGLEFEAFCAEHPDLADELRRFYEQFQELAVLSVLDGENAGLDDLLASLDPGEDRPGDGGERGDDDDAADDDDAPTDASSHPWVTLDIDTAPHMASSANDQLARLALEGFASRYRLEDEVARGGMGVIYRVWDENLRRPVAMKVVRPSDADPPAPAGAPGSPEHSVSDHALSRFLDEALVTGQLDHPGIVPVHELGVDAHGQVYFTMKLVKGHDLAAIIRKVHAGRDGWTLNRAVGALRRVCEAVAYAHSKGVIHRDIKPANVMVGRYGETYLMDWGLARVTGGDADRSALQQDADEGEPGAAAAVAEEDDPRRGRPLHTPRPEAEPADDAEPDSWLFTQDGKVIGTPIYMSPEQARGDIARVDRRSDVYSLGAMLYHLVAGRMPYAEDVELAAERGVGVAFVVLMKVRRGPPRALRELVPDAPPTLVEICERAMAREPEARFPSADAMATALGDYLEDISEAREEARRQARRAEHINEFLLEMLGSSDPSLARGREVTVREMLDKAAQRIEGALPGHPLDEAALRRTIGNLFTQLGHFEAGEAHLRRAHELLSEVRGAEHPEALELLAELSHPVRMNRGHQEAEVLLRGALERMRAVLEAEHPVLLRAEVFLAWALLQTRDGLPEAIELFRKALARASASAGVEGRLPRASLEVVSGLGQALWLSGHAAEAVEVLQQYRGALHEAFHPNEVVCLHYDISLVTSLIELGRFAEAESLGRCVLGRAKQVLEPEHSLIMNAVNNLALALSRQQRHDEAELLYAEVVARADAIDGRTLERIACHHNRGLNLLEAGRCDEALPILERALRQASRELEPGLAATARFRFTYGRCLRAQGRCAAAIEAQTRALQELLAALDPEHPWVADARRELDELGAAG